VIWFKKIQLLCEEWTERAKWGTSTEEAFVHALEMDVSSLD
jgi:hypothetical protein